MSALENPLAKGAPLTEVVGNNLTVVSDPASVHAGEMTTANMLHMIGNNVDVEMTTSGAPAMPKAAPSPDFVPA